jgi:hypothetical protein
MFFVGAVVTFCCVIAAGLINSSNQPKAPVTFPNASAYAQENIATVVVNIPTSTAGPTPTSAPTAAPTLALGKTRDKPLARNSVVDIGVDMQVMITNVQRPANQIVAEGNMFNLHHI